jgi:hypothetical protein
MSDVSPGLERNSVRPFKRIGPILGEPPSRFCKINFFTVWKFLISRSDYLCYSGTTLLFSITNKLIGGDSDLQEN